jgi:hypothetical protein
MLDFLIWVFVANQLLILKLKLVKLCLEFQLFVREELDSPEDLLHLKFPLRELILDVLVVLADFF